MTLYFISGIILAWLYSFLKKKISLKQYITMVCITEIAIGLLTVMTINIAAFIFFVGFSDTANFSNNYRDYYFKTYY